ncbi:hypothetical protein JOF29_000249 [Kribbella aluminosa]|uniref:Uncharacterized protein n=1 Tax=Kribbella aluminosa TaxID=416017 RepID=A0ABS4UC28_9ACTN|nr:hypothetical protein [Kribbella aluminosa]MBP2349166.1 hypothetical protein [Kribbella aluminosa]
MRIAGLAMNDVWAHRVLRERGVETTRTEKIDADVAVLVESMELKHHGPDRNYRPYLHLHGELRSVRPHQQLPYGVDEVTFPIGGSEPVDVFYEFDDQQLVQLAQKGYFSPAFNLPEHVTGIDWELPATIDALVLAPSGDTTLVTTPESAPDVPVVFVRVHGLGSLDVDLESSGYDITEYFADHSTTADSRHDQDVVSQTGVSARSDAFTSLFDDADFGQAPTPTTLARPGAENDTASPLATRMQAVAASLDAEQAQLRLEREEEAGTPENVYRSRVAGSLEETSAKAAIDEGPEPVASLDLDGETAENLPIEPVHTEPPADMTRLDELRRQVTLRAADLDPGEAGSVPDHQV